MAKCVCRGCGNDLIVPGGWTEPLVECARCGTFTRLENGPDGVGAETSAPVSTESTGSCDQRRQMPTRRASTRSRARRRRRPWNAYAVARFAAAVAVVAGVYVLYRTGGDTRDDRLAREEFGRRLAQAQRESTAREVARLEQSRRQIMADLEEVVQRIEESDHSPELREVLSRQDSLGLASADRLQDVSEDDTWRVSRVIDGDTLEARNLTSLETRRIRLLNVDTPEVGEDLHEAAAHALARLVDGRMVSLRFEQPNEPSMDRFGRLLAHVYVESRNVNVALVGNGWSKYERGHGEDRFAPDFEQAERVARRYRRGIWR